MWDLTPYLLSVRQMTSSYMFIHQTCIHWMISSHLISLSLSERQIIQQSFFKNDFYYIAIQCWTEWILTEGDLTFIFSLSDCLFRNHTGDIMQ